MKRLLALNLAAALIGGITVAALGQSFNPAPAPAAPDLSGYVSKSDLDAAAATNLAIMQAQIPAVPGPCGGAPASDVPGGSPGTGPTCISRSDAARPARGLWTTAVTAADCTLTWTFSTPFIASPVVQATTQDSTAGALPVLWTITAISLTSVTLKASRLRPLPASIAVVTSLASFDVSMGTCSGITAHLSAKEKL
jgi:hypothetical protein